MAALNAEKIKKLVRGERVGNIALVCCALILVGFVTCFTLAETLDLAVLRLCNFIAAPILMVAAVSVAAYYNLRFGSEIDRLIRAYVVDVFVENAALVHPDRDSLTFYITIEDDRIEVKVNNYKDIILFDFSAFGKLSALRKLTASSAVEARLSDTFCRLVTERGAKYSSVEYVERSKQKKSKKAVPVITDGQPDKAALKAYYKNRRN